MLVGSRARWQAAVAPVMVFQRRHSISERCAHKYAQEWIEQQHRRALSSYCAAPRLCPAHVQLQPQSLVSCKSPANSDEVAHQAPALYTQPYSCCNARPTVHPTQARRAAGTCLAGGAFPCRGNRSLRPPFQEFKCTCWIVCGIAAWTRNDVLITDMVPAAIVCTTNSVQEAVPVAHVQFYFELNEYSVLMHANIMLSCSDLCCTSYSHVLRRFLVTWSQRQPER